MKISGLMAGSGHAHGRLDGGGDGYLQGGVILA